MENHISEYDAIRARFALGHYDYIDGEQGEEEEEDEQELAGYWEDLGPLFFEEDDFGNTLTLTSFTTPVDEEVVLAGEVSIFPGSGYSMKDMCRFLLFVKCQNSTIGDRLFASIFGVLPAFLPPDNGLIPLLPKDPSMYNCLKLVRNLGNIPQDMRVYVVNMCSEGCLPFWKDTAHSNFCSKCQGCRWKYCSATCYNDQHEKICSHRTVAVRSFYYLPMRDRIEKLLLSDMKNMFMYEKYRYKSDKEGFVDDIFESDTYGTFKTLIPDDCHLIYLQVCSNCDLQMYLYYISCHMYIYCM